MRTTIEDFLERSINAHGNTYDYSKVVYETVDKKVIIDCKIHGEFLMRPRAHYTDLRGCPNCEDGKKSGFSYNSNCHLSIFSGLLCGYSPTKMCERGCT